MLKNGVFWAEWVQVGPKSGASRAQVGIGVRGERTTETGRFEGLFGFGGGIVPLGGRGAIYGGF